MSKTKPNETPTLWLDEGLPVVRAGRGKVLARGTSLTEGKTNRENAEYIRQVLSRPDSKIRINGKLY